MDDSMEVLFVSGHPRVRAAVERSLPAHGPLDVTTASSAAAALDLLSEIRVDCIAVEHGVAGDASPVDGVDADVDAVRRGDGDMGASERGEQDAGRDVSERDEQDADRDASERGERDRDSDATNHETDALRVLRLVRDSDPAVPVVVFETAGASPVASDAISLDVTEYVRETAVEDPLGTLARACRNAGESYRTQQDVAMLNDLARNVYERVTDGFFALDRGWQFTYVNDAAEDILEVDADDVLGENLWDVFPDAVGTDFYTEYHRAMAAQEPVTFREHYAPLEKTFEMRAFPSEDGLSVHFRTVVEDEGAERSDLLLELTNVLSADLLDSIDALRSDLEGARESAADPAEIEAALDSVDRMESLVNYSIRLASERPTPGSHQTE